MGDGKPTPIPPDANVRTHSGGEKFDPFFTAVYVDDYLQDRAQHSDDDTTALITSASLGSDHVRLFGPGKVGVTPVLTPKKSNDWDTTIDALGFTISSHTMTMLVPREKDWSEKEIAVRAMASEQKGSDGEGRA